jgi:hypothetical protein
VRRGEEGVKETCVLAKVVLSWIGCDALSILDAKLENVARVELRSARAASTRSTLM